MSSLQVNVLGVVLVVCGLFQIFGYVSQNNRLFLFGQALAMAPLPMPFRNSDGYENFASVRSYDVAFTDGTHIKLDRDRELVAALSGPHRRKIVYMQAMMFLPRMPQRISTPVLEYLLCQSDFVSSLGIVPSDRTMKSVTVTTRVKTVGREKDRWDDTIVCR